MPAEDGAAAGGAGAAVGSAGGAAAVGGAARGNGKKSMMKRKFDEELVEDWIECHQCGAMVHAICALGHKTCPMCVLSTGPAAVSAAASAASPKTPRVVHKASSLPRCGLSDFLEALLSEQPFPGGALTIRIVSNYDSLLLVPEAVRGNLPGASGSLPEGLAYRQKCITLWQCIDGVDVLILALYVQEFDQYCQGPNERTVYIAYLDSVDYLRTSQYR